MCAERLMSSLRTKLLILILATLADWHAQIEVENGNWHLSSVPFRMMVASLNCVL